MTQAVKSDSKAHKLKKVGILFIVIIVFLGILGGKWYIDSQNFITTEDARIASNTLKVATKIPGKVKSVLVKEGDIVTANQLLAVFDNRDLELILQQSQAAADAAKNKAGSILNGTRPEELEIGRSKIDMAQVTLKQAKDEFSRQKQLFDQRYISQKDYDNAVNAVELADKNLKMANDSYNLLFKGARGEDRELVLNQLKQAAAARDLAEYNLTNSSIYAPIGGKIVQKTINVGEYVSAGQTMFSVIDPQDIWVTANIKETDIYRVKLGQPVYIHADAYPKCTFHGKISDLGIATTGTFALLQLSNSSGNFVKVVQNIPVKILLEKSDKLLPVGSSVTVKIGTRKK
jgi:membrane fusion protein (multidrug efflux system)